MCPQDKKSRAAIPAFPASISTTTQKTGPKGPVSVPDWKI